MTFIPAVLRRRKEREMTDSGNTGIAPKNTGGDYPARPPTEAAKGIFVHYAGKRFYFGRKTESGRNLRRFFGVPETETLYLENPGGGEPTVIIEDETAYPLADGQHYRSEPIPVPAPIPEAAKVDFTDRTKPGMNRPVPDTRPNIGQDSDRLSKIEETLARIEGTALRAADEAKRARTLAEENEALARKNADALTDLKAGLLALAGEIGDRIPYRRPPTPTEEAVAAAVRAEVGRTNPPAAPDLDGGIPVTCNGTEYRFAEERHVGRDLRAAMAVPDGHTLYRANRDGGPLEASAVICDGEKTSIAPGDHFFSLPNRQPVGDRRYPASL